jgi:magnesium transporter
MPKLSDSEKWSLLSAVDASQAAGDLAGKTGMESPAGDLGVAYMVEVVSQLGSDAAADLLRSLPADFSAQVVKELPGDRASDIQEILSYQPGTAGAMMAKEYLHIPDEMNVADAIEFLHLIPKERKGKVPYVYIVGKDKKPRGVIQTRDLIFNPLDTTIGDIQSSPVIAVDTNASQEEVAQLLRQNRFLALPVINGAGEQVGIVSADNVLQFMKEQADKDIARMIGTSHEEMKSGSGSIPRIMSVRLPWLFVNIVSGLLCAWIAGIFEHGTGAATVLLLFVPVVLGLSESTGIQGATIVVRNLTLGSVSFRNLGSLFFKEIIVGVLIGLICGAIVGVVTSIWHGSPLLGVAMAVSLNIAIIVSAVIGLCLPLLFKTLKIDPAMASGPLVLAICDIQTLMVYFNLAGLILRA